MIEQWRLQRTCLARDVTGRFADADAARAWSSANGYNDEDAEAAAEAWEQALHEEDFDEGEQPITGMTTPIVTAANAVAPVAPPSAALLLKIAAKSRKRAPPPPDAVLDDVYAAYLAAGELGSKWVSAASLSDRDCGRNSSSDL